MQNIWQPEEFQKLVDEDYADVGEFEAEVDYLGSQLERHLKRADDREETDTRVISDDSPSRNPKCHAATKPGTFNLGKRGGKDILENLSYSLVQQWFL